MGTRLLSTGLLRGTTAAALLPALAAGAARDGDSGAAPDERVHLYPTAAALDPESGRWQLPIHLLVYEPEAGDPLRATLLGPLRLALDLESGSADEQRFATRMRPFLADHERGEHRDVRLAGRRFAIGPTAPNGHAFATLELAPEELVAAGAAPAIDAPGAPAWLDVEVGTPGTAGHATTRLALVGREGLSIVCDVDDTLKVSEIGDRRATLRRTFVEEFEAIPGMAALLQRLAARGAAFHYVSLSPWQLAPALEEFLAREGFPPGELALQHLRVKDGDFADLFGDSHARKLAAVEPLLARWPARRFVLVGDSSQDDPEVYAELARRRPGQVAAVWIRDTPPPARDAAGHAPEAIALRRAALERRLAALFAATPATPCHLFRDPAELPPP